MLNNQWAQPGGTMCPGCWPEDIMNGENVFPPETGYDPWHTIDGKPYYIPMEVCYRATTRWVDAYDNEPRPLAELVETWQKSVGRGANLLLNLPPDRTGRIPEPVVERALAMSREVGRV
jgi:alpha-L-fucosidase